MLHTSGLFTKRSFFLGYLLLCLTPAFYGATLPRWTSVTADKDSYLELAIPARLNQLDPGGTSNLEFLVLNLASDWTPDWQKAALDLKNLIITARTRGPRVRVGIQGSEEQINRLLEYEMAAYIDGYVFDENPFIPDADETGKLWQRVKSTENQVLNTLVDAASLGIELVLFENTDISGDHRDFLAAITRYDAGALDEQPQASGMPQQELLFFLEADTGNYYLAVYAPKDRKTLLMFSLAEDMKVDALYPQQARFKATQYGKRTEIALDGDAYYFFKLEPGVKSGSAQSLQVVARENIDPYELVVQNQVFKDREAQKLKSLVVEERQNFRYETPGGGNIDVTFEDTLYVRPGQPMERVRNELFLGGVRWTYKKLPELPLIEPEKVQSVPLDVELNKTYKYTYQGTDEIDGNPTWKVRFEPTAEGDFFSGTVWIDQKTGAHRKLRATQSGLESPVVGNEITAWFDWVEDGGERYWTQVKSFNLQILTVAGLRLALQIDGERFDFRFNRPEIEDQLAKAYEGDGQILRDSDKGFRYLTKKDGQRVVSEQTFTTRKALLGGVFFDPAQDTPLPLAGLNYTNLDFMGRGYQANFFIAGAINDLIVSNPDFLGKGWDLTGELFVSAFAFEDSIYEMGREVEELGVKQLSESFNLTLGIPVTDFLKLETNYALRYLDYGAGKKMRTEDDEVTTENQDFPVYRPPVSTFEHIGRVGLLFNKSRFSSRLEYEMVKRSDWEEFGIVGQFEPVQDQFSKLSFDATVSKRLPRFQTIEGNVRYIKGWDLDRFSQIGFGFFENRVSGFGSSGARGDEALRLSLEYEIGVSGIFNLDLKLDGARAWTENFDIEGNPFSEPVDLAGIGVAANFMGPWGTLIRFDLGYGLHSDLEGEEGDVSGQIVFLKLY